MPGHIEKVAICRLGREPSLETEPDETVILDFPESRTEREYISDV